MEENNKINEELETNLDDVVNDDQNSNVSEYNQQNEILKNSNENGKKLVLQRPFLTKVGSTNSIWMSNMGRKNNAGFVPMVTVAGILVLMGIIIAYIIFGV